MSRKKYIILNVITGLIKGTFLLIILFWLLPSFGIAIPGWGLALTIIAFLAYEIITFKIGVRSITRKTALWPESLIGCIGTATTPLNPDGYIQIKGELWQASSRGTYVEKGDEVVIVESNRLTLSVIPFSEKTLDASIRFANDTNKKHGWRRFRIPYLSSKRGSN